MALATARPRRCATATNPIRRAVESRSATTRRLILLGIVAAARCPCRAARAGVSRSARLAPDFLTEFVLYALSATNLTMLVALVFVLARNIVKLIVERRRGLPFARFRAKLVAVLLGMTIMPAVLVLIVGSELIRNSVDRWFNAPMDEVLSSANAIAGDYYQEQQRLVSARGAAAGASAGVARSRRRPASSVRDVVAGRCTAGAASRWSRCIASTHSDGRRAWQPVVDVAAPHRSRATTRRASAAIAGRARRRRAAPRRAMVEQLPNGGELIRIGGADPVVALGRLSAASSSPATT